jgi:Double zinc ribbon
MHHDEREREGNEPVADPTVSPPPEEAESYPAVSAQPAAADTLTRERQPAWDEAPVSTAAPVTPSRGTTESTRCPRCGTENRPGLAFCTSCGQRLVAAGIAPTVQRPAAPEGSQACPRCGTYNRAGVAFCQNCGANLRPTTAPSYVPPSVASPAPARVAAARGALLGPIVLLIGIVGLVTAYLLPFAYGTTSLFERAMGSGGYGPAFWRGYDAVGGALADQAYFGFAAPTPLLALVLLALAVAGFVRAAPGRLQTIGLGVALIWSVGLAALFVLVELVGNMGGDLVALLSALSPAGIIFFLAALIVLIGTLTRFSRG